jgi:hypothetical protein
MCELERTQTVEKLYGSLPDVRCIVVLTMPQNTKDTILTIS